jgi:Nuclease-related domain
VTQKVPVVVAALRATDSGVYACPFNLPGTQPSGFRAEVDAMGSDAAGSSARREYERRRAARERAVRGRHPRVGGLLLALGQAPPHERGWERGAEGEECAAARLTRLLRTTPVVLLHDRWLPGSRANIDHLAVGPGGITVIDTKRLAGRVEVRSKLLDGAARQLAVVSASFEEVDVRAALCFVEPSGLPLLGRLQPRGILIGGPRGVARLAKRSGPLDTTRIDELVAALDRRFPKAA